MQENLSQQIADDMKHDGNELKVRKSNELIQNSRFSLSVLQQRMVLYVISQLDESIKEKNFALDVYISDFCRICGLNGGERVGGRQFEEIKKSMIEVRNQGVWIKLPDGGETTFSWFSEVHYNQGLGTLTIKLNEWAFPYLLDLRKKYTEYELIYALNFRSKYSVRLYELLRSYNFRFNRMDSFKKSFTVEELEARMDAKNYNKYTNFKLRALEPAVKEINMSSDMDIDYKEIRRGRGGRVVEIQFSIIQKDYQARMLIRDEAEKRLGWDQVSMWE